MIRGTSKLAEVAWECVHFREFNSLNELPDLQLAGFEIFEVDTNEISTKEQLLGSIAEAMSFPDYFGGNWDALDECLRDMQWAHATGYVLLVRSAESLWRRNPRIAAGLLQSWTFSAEAWSREGVAFHLVFAW